MDDATKETLQRIEERLARLEDKVDSSSDGKGLGCLGLVLFGVVIWRLLHLEDLVEILVAGV